MGGLLVTDVSPTDDTDRHEYKCSGFKWGVRHPYPLVTYTIMY